LQSLRKSSSTSGDSLLNSSASYKPTPKMTSMALEIGQHWAEAKLQRASRRAHSVHKDRQDYNRALAKREKSQDAKREKLQATQKEERTSSMPASCRHARPHGAARAVARSWLAKGEVTCEKDMPSVSIGHPDMHKPTATRLASCKRKSQRDEVDSDVDTSVPDDRLSEKASPTLSCLEDHPVYEELSEEDSLGEPALAFEPEYFIPGDWSADADRGTLHFLDTSPTKPEQQGQVRTRTNRFGDMSVDSHSTTFKLRGYAVLDRFGDTSVLAHTTHSQPRSYCLNNRFGDMSVNSHSTTWKLRGYCVRDRFGDVSVDGHSMNSNAKPSHETPCASHETPCVNREQILREVVCKLRLQAREAEQEAGEAKAHVQEVQEKAAAQNLKEELSARKQALQTEKQRVAQLRKQRNQAAHLDAIKEKADRALQEAAAIREQAQDDAILMRAQVLAKASSEAHEQAEMHRETELLVAQAEAEALKADSWEAAKQAEILKAEAAAEAEALKMLAGMEQAAAAETKAQAVAMHAEAERAARMIREEALEDVVALKTRVFDQLREKAEAENKARQEASEEFAKESARLAAFSEAEAKRKAQATVQQEAAAALKLGKAMQQQSARKIHKQSEQERRQCVEIDAMKAAAEAEMQDIKQKAMNEVAAMKAKAKVDANKARNRAIAAAKTEALERAQAEAAALRAQAEKEAELIKTKAAQDVEDLMRQAQTTAQPIPHEEALDDNCLPAVAAVADEKCDLEADEDWQLLPAEVPTEEDWDLLVDDALMIV